MKPSHQQNIQVSNETQQNISFKTLWHNALAQQLSVALWRLPQTSEKHLVVDFSGETKQVKADFETLTSGFIVSPFLNPDLTKTYFIEANAHVSSEKGWLKGTAEQQQLLSSKNATESTNFLPTFTQDVSCPSFTAAHYQEIVAKAVAEMQRGSFQKVVLSRKKLVPLAPNFEAVALFDKLCKAYPNAFVSLFSLPSVGVWLCATPELLVSTDENQTFRTIALAGTQAAAQAISQTSWTHKEIEEQAMVSRYIVNCFKKIRLREYTETGPRTVAAGNLLHLRTDFEVDMQATNFPQLGTVMQELLHPTSAVCGMPKPEATAFILANENYDRSLYSGFLGPVNVNGQCQTFVHLRCTQLFDGYAVLYAGAGITADSNPAKEWQETELKCQTLGTIISE